MTEYTFQAEKVRDTMVANLKTQLAKMGCKRVVIGISGGKDSTVTAALCARAIGPQNVYGVMLPDGEQKDISDSIRVCDALGIQKKTVNIGAMHRALHDNIMPAEGEFGFDFSKESDINVGPRLRMTVLRYIAQAIGAFLAGTGNLSEATVGYCTKDGDTSCDFSVLGRLTSIEVVKLGLTMPELPRELVEKTPTDGLSGVSDEVKLGLKYADIHSWIRFGTCGDAETDAKIAAKERANAHKRRMPTVIEAFEAM